MPVSEPKEAAEQATEYEISLVEPAEQRYVEANPEAPENEPDLSERYSFRNQQAADESPLSDPENTPRVEGESEEAAKILQGILEQSPPVTPGVFAPNQRPGEGEGNAGGEAGNPSEAMAAEVAQPMPAPDFIEQEVVAEAGPGSRPDPAGKSPEVVERPEPDAPIDVYRPPAERQPQTTAANGGGSPERTAKPRPRPRLAPELTTGTLMQSNSSARRRGALAVDATFSEFGEYERQFYAAVQTGWFQEIEFFQPIDTATQVLVRFTLHADGRVSDVEAVKSNASEIATFICENAISKRSPFRPWTREMVRVFGEERTIRVRFNYL